MITDAKTWAAFEDEAIRADKPDFRRNIRLVEAMYREAVALGALPPENPLEGIEVDIRIARVVNGVPPRSCRELKPRFREIVKSVQKRPRKTRA